MNSSLLSFSIALTPISYLLPIYKQLLILNSNSKPDPTSKNSARLEFNFQKLSVTLLLIKTPSSQTYSRASISQSLPKSNNEPPFSLRTNQPRACLTLNSVSLISLLNMRALSSPSLDLLLPSRTSTPIRTNKMFYS